MASSGVVVDIQKECPVCMENFIAPIYQCSNKHLLCKNCIPHLDTCPVCRGLLPSQRIRNYEAEAFIAAMPFSCTNKDLGCNERSTHEPIDCAFAYDNFCCYLGILKCQEFIKREELESHLTNNHDILGKSTTLGETVQVSQHGGTWRQIENGEVEWKPNFFVQGGRTFFLRTKVSSTSIISWVIYVVGSEDTAKQYTAKIKLIPSSEKMKGMYFKWSGQVFSLTSRIRKDHTFNLRVDQLKPLMEGNSSDTGFLLNVVIRKTKPETENRKAEPIRIDSKAVRVLGVHSTTQCDVCLIKPITGMRYKCVECEDYDLCSTCAHAEINHNHHLFIMVYSPIQRRLLFGAFTQLHSVSPTWNFEEENSDVHVGITCDGCGMCPFQGPRHKCIVCEDYDLCSRCAGLNRHEHGMFLVAITPNTTGKLRSAFGILGDVTRTINLPFAIL